MALVLKDRVKETTTTTGTGTYTLAGAVTGFEAFSEVGDGNTTYYACTDGTDFEVGIGTYTASGTTLARTTILQSSNADAAVSWSAGSKTIFITQPAEKAVFLNADGDIEVDGGNELRLTSLAGEPVMRIGGGGPNGIRFVDGSDFGVNTNAVDIKYRTGTNDLLVETSGNNKIAEFGGDDGHAALYFLNSKKLETLTGGVDITGDITVSGTVDGRDLATDGSKLDGIEASADVTDTANVTAAGALMDSEVTNLAQVKAFDSSDYATAAQGTTADSAMQDLSDDTSPTLGGALSTGGNQIQLSQTSGVAIETTGNLGNADLTLLSANNGTSGQYGFDIIYKGTRTGNANSFALNMHNQLGTDVEAITVYQDGKVGINNTAPTAPLDVTGNIVVSGTVDGRDLATDGSKLDGIEASADVTDTTNVTAAGALMDSEVTNLAQVKAFDSSDYATAAQGTTADAAMPKAGGTFTGDVTFTGDSYNVVWDKSDNALEFADNARAKFGTGSDLQIYHDGSGSFISETGTGQLYINSTPGGWIRVGSGDETSAYFKGNGAAELYYDNVKKLETTADGVMITSTDDGADEKPTIKLFRDSSSPADNDEIGEIEFVGKNDAAEDVTYTRIFTSILDASDGTEDCRLEFKGLIGGAEATYLQMKQGVNYFYRDIELTTSRNIRFEGSTSDNFETTVTVTDPTADRTITLPDATGTVITTGNSDTPTTTTSAADADFVLVDDGGTMKKITPANLGITAGAASVDDATALAIALG
jgi:hypothetical protein